MDMELEKKLIEKFPAYFIEMYGDEAKTCMHFGIETGNGWYRVLEHLCERILEEGEVPEGFRFTQIKEKFGMLRIYCDYANERIYRLIDEAENVTAHICEICGELGTMSDSGWMRVRCDVHKH